MTVPPQRWEPATCRLTCHGQSPREASWPPEALLEFTPLPQSGGKSGVREDALYCHRTLTSRHKRAHNSVQRATVWTTKLLSVFDGFISELLILYEKKSLKGSVCPKIKHTYFLLPSVAQLRRYQLSNIKGTRWRFTCGRNHDPVSEVNPQTLL